VKKSLIITAAFVLLLFSYGNLTARWDHVYYVAGGLCLVGLAGALFTLVDRLILGDRGRLFSGEERKERRSDVIKQYLVASGLLFIPAITGFLLK